MKPTNDSGKDSIDQAKQGAAASPGDNRSADDVDGNRSGGASKAKGPVEPEAANDDDESASKRR